MTRRQNEGGGVTRRRERDGAGPLARLVPLACAVALLAFGLVRESLVAESAATAAVGFGVAALAAALHLLALRLPRRYAVDGAAWVVTIVAVLLALGLGVSSGR